MGKRIRLTGDYVNGRLSSVKFSNRSGGAFTMQVSSDEQTDTDERRTSEQRDRRRLTFREWATKDNDREKR